MRITQPVNRRSRRLIPFGSGPRETVTALGEERYEALLGDVAQDSLPRCKKAARGAKRNG